MYVPKSEADQIVSFPENGLDTTHYEVVQSNWSREYNDVNVPYALGKGFYASVEKKNATGLGEKVLVRLPKADDSYKEGLHGGDNGSGSSISIFIFPCHIRRTDNKTLLHIQCPIFLL